MKKIVTVVLVTLFNINICFAQINFPIERPILKQGERWKTATVDALTKIATGWQEEIMIGVGADMLLTSVKTDGGAQSNLRYDLDTNRLTDIKGKLEKETKLSFPLEMGKSWKSRWEWINANGREGRMEVTYKVLGSESITVAAGSFDAVIVSGDGYWYNKTTGSSGRLVEKLWYAPQAKRIIRRTWLTRFENGTLDQNILYEAAEVEIKQ